MNEPRVTGPTTSSNSFSSETIQICVVTRDRRRTMAGMVRAGIGPWRVDTFGPETCTELTRRGRPERFTFELCRAWTGAMFREIVEPLEGPSIHEDFLERHGEGVHHPAFACGDLPWAERVRQFESRGFPCIQSGKWLGIVPWAYFGTEDATTTIFEIFDIPPGFQMPEPEAWYPAPPPG